MLAPETFKLSINHFLIVTAAYITAFSLTLGFAVPLQKVLLPSFSATIWLLYLPHGVRIITFYFFGWKGLVYLLPGVLIMTFLATVTGVPFRWHFAVAGIISCYIGYKLGTLLIGERTPSFTKSKWKFFLITGTMSSLVNAGTLAFLRKPEDILSYVMGYMIGDVIGLMIVFYALIVAFRFARNLSKI